MSCILVLLTQQYNRLVIRPLDMFLFIKIKIYNNVEMSQISSNVQKRGKIGYFILYLFKCLQNIYYLYLAKNFGTGYRRYLAIIVTSCVCMYVCTYVCGEPNPGATFHYEFYCPFAQNAHALHAQESSIFLEYYGGFVFIGS